KTINDTFGHETGDNVLKLFAATAHRCLARCSIVARMGGEEFAAVFSGEQSVAAELAEKVRTRFADRAATVDGQNICATVSVGVASDSGVPGDSSDLSALFRRADAALYAAKRLGRNRVECAESAQMADIETSRLAPRRVPVRRAKRGGRIALGA
ncbi:MAG: GGDEF domain-containing protein, partial [Hyphomicrobiales bacterium]